MTSLNAKQVLGELVRMRDNVQHEACVMQFLQRLEVLPPDATIELHEVLGPMAALIHACLPPTHHIVAMRPGLQRTMTTDEHGAKHHGVTMSDVLPISERSH